MTDLRTARLILADGTVFRGRSVGAPGESGGEVVFNTCLSGYQEVLTDPSYRGQIVTMTSPHIGNYGTNLEDEESERPWLSGFIVRELTPLTSNFRSQESLRDYLVRHGIVALDQVDTRALTRCLRREGAMKGLIATEPLSDEELRRRLDVVPELEGRDLVKEVTRGVRLPWVEGYGAFMPAVSGDAGRAPHHVVVLDYGAKANIFRSLVHSGFKVTILPAGSTTREILQENPDGVLLSNGPGDPRVLHDCVAAVRGLLGKVPVFGICLGHQILAAALGADLFKLKFGHHGGNHPVKDLITGRVEITSQNHGFAVDPTSLKDVGAEVSHVNLNDGTVEGIVAPGHRAMSVQYHPEAAPGPRDALHLFERFRQLIAESVEAV